MANETVTFKTVIPPSQPGGWASVEISDGRRPSIHPDKWELLKQKISVGASLLVDLYNNKNDPTKWYIAPAKPEKQGGGGPKPQNNAGMAVGAAINNAVSMLNAGKITDVKQIEPTARAILVLSIKLKEEFKDKL